MEEYDAYAGLDVHKDMIVPAVAYAGRSKPEVLGTIRNTKRSVQKLVKRLTADGAEVAFCYEAGPCGYEVFRWIVEMGHVCQVVAPSKIPKKPGDRVKTDRKDAAKLAHLYRAGDLTAVWVPDEEQEGIRDLTRAREEMKRVELKLKQRLAAFLLRHDKRYEDGKSRWTQKYFCWLSDLNMGLPVQQLVLEEYVDAVRKAEERVRHLDEEMQRALESWSLKQVVESLMALRGVKLVTAMSLVAELGDLSRFESPRQLMAYLGLVPGEHTSSGKPNRFGITKTGNGRVRRLLVESAWCYRYPARRTTYMRSKGKHASEQVQAIAWKAQKRLNYRFTKLMRKGKAKGQTTTAIARELCGFIWAIGCEAMGKPTTAAA